MARSKETLYDRGDIMKLEFLKNKEEKRHIINRGAIGCTLDSCMRCNAPLHAHVLYRHVCDACASQLSHSQRQALWESVQHLFP